MYQVESARILFARGGRSRRRGLRVSRTVVLVGLTSLFTYVSAEMVTTVLPLYVFFAFGAAPLVVSVIDGLYQGATALLQVVGGLVADRSRRHKEVAAAGYGISAVCKLGLVLAGGAPIAATARARQGSVCTTTSAICGCASRMSSSRRLASS
jgi:hypothetical protein